jgi:copper chaperone CopZ
MANKINIKFAAQGHPGVIAAVKALNKQTEKLAATNRLLTGAAGPLTKSQQEVAKGFLSQQRAARNAQGTFSVLRSKMLLASFAAGLFSQSLLKLANMAGDAEEQMNKASVVFGTSTDAILQFAQDTSDATGRSRFSLIQMTASVQDILVPMGMLRHEAASLSKEIVKTAIDVASFNNVTESDAMRDFNSALVGNHETVRKYGIVISEARMQQVAMDQGIIKAGETLTDQQKILARLAILQMDSSDAMGDAERTADSYANVMKALSAEFEETAIILGQKLMPIVKSFAKVMIGMLDAITNLNVWLALTLAINKSALSFLSAKMATDGFTKSVTFARTAMTGLLKVAGKFSLWMIGFEAVGYIWDKVFPAKEDTDDATKSLEDITKSMNDYQKSLSLLTIDQIESQIKSLSETIRTGKLTIVYPPDSEGMRYTEIIKLSEEKIAELKEQLALTQQEFDNLTGANLDLGKAQSKVLKETDKLSMRKYINDDTLGKQRLANELMDRYGLTLGKVKKEQEALQTELETFIELEGKSIGLNEIGRLEKRIQKIQGVSAAQMFLNEQAAKGVVITQEHADKIRELNTLFEVFEEEKERMQLVAEGQDLFNQIIEESGNKELIEIENKLKKLEALAEEIGLTNELAEAIANLQAQKEEVEDLDGKTHKLSMFRDKAQKDSTLLLMDSMSAMAAQHKQGQKAAARISQLAAIINTYEGVTEALSKQDYVGAAIVLAQGLASVAQIENAMGKMGAGGGSGSKPSGVFGSFEQGGYVGGRRHSEGGTLIEAERGEFVMSRRAVESIGLETLNQLNSGTSGAGSVVVNVSGNVMTQDFVEGELAESIKEAVRRGSDFGIG